VLACGLVLVLAGLAGAAIGAARVARHHAKVAADLGALAGAMRAVEGAAVACARAADLAAANHARLTACHVEGLDVIATTSVTVTLPTGFAGTATATSRAGPVPSR
jgi:secretion/DNA translocation related TadE-like protein